MPLASATLVGRMTFEFERLRFCFTAREAVRFPAGRAGNVLRGTLGAALHRVAPAAYETVFVAAAAVVAPSGYRDRPRPFVLRVRPLDGIVVTAGDRFEVGVHLFDRRE